jgi:hypothetical protein
MLVLQRWFGSWRTRGNEEIDGKNSENQTAVRNCRAFEDLQNKSKESSTLQKSIVSSHLQKPTARSFNSLNSNAIMYLHLQHLQFSNQP